MVIIMLQVYRQHLQNVSIDKDIVRGQVFIYNVWSINQNWTLDSIRHYFKEVRFYTGVAQVGSGWSPISNEIKLITQ